MDNLETENRMTEDEIIASEKERAAELEQMRKRKSSFQCHLPRYNELSPFPIYMAQLLDILDRALAPFMVPGDEQIITKSMINNYVQKKVILSPENKKYNRVHIIHLIAIGVLKQVVSIEEITQMVHMQLEKYPKISIAYNFFCIGLEDALNEAFNGVKIEDRNKRHRPTTILSEAVRSSLLTFAHRIYVKKILYLARPKNYERRIKTPVKMIMTAKTFQAKNG